MQYSRLALVVGLPYIACPTATDCQSGEGSCGFPPLALTDSMLTVSGSPNIALNRPSLQSTLQNGEADDGSTNWAGRVVDGDRTTAWGGGSCTETQLSGGSGSTNPWWRVDLGATYSIGSVAIYHRSDCCSDRMHAAVVYSSNVDSYDDAVLSAPCGMSTWVSGGLETISCDADATAGRYVFVVIPFANRILSLCELEVFATSPVAVLIDGDALTAWYSAVPAWIKVDLGTPTRVLEYSIQNGASAAHVNDDSPTTVVLGGSDEDATIDWIDLHEASNLVWSAASQRKSFSVSSTAAYRFFRIYFAYSARWVVLSDIEIVGRHASCADLNADGVDDDQFDCSNHANPIDPSPEDISCATSSCTAVECCTPTNCQPTLSIDPPVLSATRPQAFSVRASLHQTDSRCDDVSYTSINLDQLDGVVAIGGPGVETRGNPNTVIDMDHTPGSWVSSPLAELSTCAEQAYMTIDLGASHATTGAAIWHYYGTDRAYCSQKLALSVTGAFAGEETVVFDTGTCSGWCTFPIECGNAEAGDCTPDNYGPTESPDGNRFEWAPTYARYLRHWSGRNQNTGVHFMEIDVYESISWDDVSESISYQWAVSTIAYEQHTDKQCSGYQEHNNAGGSFAGAVELCNAAGASCSGISDYLCDNSWFTLCDSGSTLNDHSRYCSYMQVSTTLPLAGVRLDGPVLTLPAFTLPPLESPSVHRISVTASANSTNEVFTQHAMVSVQPLPLVATILGPQRRTVRTTSVLILDASSSFDQDVAPLLRSSDSLAFSWTCLAIASNSECAQNEIDILAANTSKLEAEVVAQTGTFDVTVEVAKEGKASVLSTTTIVVVGSTAPTVTVEPLQSGLAKFNADSTLSMIGEVTGEVTSWEWTVIDGADIIKINFQPPDMAVPDGFLKDSGGLYGAHANGYSYGWSCDLEALGDYRDRNSMGTAESSLVIPDRYQNCETENWKIAVPNGQYVVKIGFFDPSYDTDVSGCTIQGDAVAAQQHGGARGDATVVAGTVTEHHAQVDVADGFITFDGEWQSDDGLHCQSISYMVIEPGSGNFVVVPSDKSLTPLEGKTTGIANLVLSPGVFAAGGVYTFRLTARASGESGYGEVVLLANTIPSGGVMQCSPTTGYAIETLFSLRTDGWTDDDEGPLSYRFGHSQPSGVTMLSDFSASYTTSAILPQGETIVDLLEVFVEARDIYLGVGQAYLGITVHETQIPMSDFASTTESLLALSSGDVHTTSQLISSLTATLNSNQRGGSSSLSVQEAATARTRITAALETVFDAANENPTPEAFERVAASVAAVVQEPQELNQDATNTALSILQALSFAGKSFASPIDAVARATSSLFDSVDQQRGSAAQDKIRGESLSSIIENVGDSIANAALDGQIPSVLVTSRFNMTIARDLSRSFEGRSLSRGAVIVPNGAFADVTGSVFAQVVEHDGAGPLFYTNDKLADGPGAQQASGVTSVTFKRLDSLVSDGRRALQLVSEEVTLTNLTEPFLISIALSSSRPDHSTNTRNLTLEEVELYISRLWNRSILQAEALAVSPGGSVCAAYVNETAYVAAVKRQEEKFRLRKETNKIICPQKPGSCDAAMAQEQAGLQEKAIPGCRGIRGGADDCAFYPEACACFRGLLRNAYTKESVLCTHWDGHRWNNDGLLVQKTETSATCAFTHLTSFRNFVGPPVNFNRMSVAMLFDKEWISRNPVSAITAFVTLLFSIITTMLAVRVYKDLVFEVTDPASDRSNYEARSSDFVHQRQLLERDDVNWFQQLATKLRTDWPLGALLFGFSGDPFPKTQRVLVLWGSILVGMVLNVLFFTMPDPNCYADCPDETYTEGSTKCSEICDKECRGNGLLSSVLSAVLSIPVCGTLNLVFAWLRRPFDGDLATKEGVIEQRIRERATETSDHHDNATEIQTTASDKPSRCVPCRSQVREWMTRRKRCIRATCPCLRGHQIHPEFAHIGSSEALMFGSSTGNTSCSHNATERARLAEIMVTTRQQKRVRRHTVTKVGKINRRDAGHKRREHELSLEQLWKNYDPEQTGEIHQDELRSLMEDLNFPDPVSDEAVAYIIDSADVSATGTISRGELRMAVPLYLALQGEQLHADELFNQLKLENGELPTNQLSWLLAEVSGIAPSQSEIVWIVNVATRSKTVGSDSVDTMPSESTLTRMEVRRAVVVWAPQAHKRQVVPPPPKNFVGDPNSRRYKVRQQMEQIEEQLKPQFETKILTSEDLRRMMNGLNKGEQVSDVALSFVLHAANITSPYCIYADEVLPALALYVALHHEQETIDAKFGEYDTDQSGALNRSQLTNLLADLDGGTVPSELEVDWVMKTSAIGEHSQKALGHAELRRAVALWFPRVMTRRAIEQDVKRAVGHDAGARRRAVAAQLPVHQLWVEAALKSRQQQLLMHDFRLASDSDSRVDPGTISRRDLHLLMQKLAGGDKVPSDEVEFVLLLADHPTTESRVMQSDLIRPLAMWRGLQEEMKLVDAQFRTYDTKNTGRLDRKQLAKMIKDLNGGHTASSEEIDWMLSLSTDGRSLTHQQTRLAITIWFHHVAPLEIRARVGRAMLIPFVYTLVACTAAAVVVAATTVLFSEQKTREWLAAVGMSLMFRNLLIDPLKAVMFGRSFEFIFALVFGGCALEEAGVGLLQDEIEGQGEAVAEGAGDVVADLADDGGEGLVGAAGGDGAIGGGMEGELTAGAGRASHDGSDDEDVEPVRIG